MDEEAEGGGGLESRDGQLVDYNWQCRSGAFSFVLNCKYWEYLTGELVLEKIGS